MDFSKLDQNEKMALGAAVVVFLLGVISNWGGLFWLAVLAALGMVVVVLLPQFSPTTSLPGSKGTLMATMGIIAVVAGAIEILRFIGYIATYLADLQTIEFLIAVVAAIVMAYAGWTELQLEGGRWVFGSPAAPASATAAETAPSPGEPMDAAEPANAVDEDRTPEA